MLRKRVIPVLLINDGDLVKTIKFKNPRYIGDPINAVKIFNEKEVDELIVLDITRKKNKINYEFIQDLANECFMPFGYGGGIKSVEQAIKIIKLGAEKIILNTNSLDEKLLQKLIKLIGSQSIVISIDIKSNFFGKQFVYLNHGKIKINDTPISFAKKMEKIGVGEIILNFIDREGTFNGYDLNLIRTISNEVKIPVVALGGAGSMKDLRDGFEAGASAVAAGSKFIFFGPNRAVLINYIDHDELEKQMK